MNKKEMTIKEDLDDALAEIESRETQDKERIKKSFEEQHQALKEYLKESDIISNLEDISAWAKSKGFPFSRITSKNDIELIEFNFGNQEHLNYHKFIFQILEKNFLFKNTIYAEVECRMGTVSPRVRSDHSFEQVEGLVPKWTITGLNGILDPFTEEEMLTKIKEKFVNLIDSTRVR